MISYLVILALGLAGVYNIREALIMLQDRRDKKLETIIANNGEQCKQFKQTA